MSSTLNLSLTDELRAFIDENSGDGTLFATPSEFIRDLVRKQKERTESKQIRNSILEGYQDLINGNVHEFKGDLGSLLKKVE